MLDRVAAVSLAAYAVWHAYKHARRPRWADHLHDLQREQIENQERILALANQGGSLTAAVIAAVNGDIGGKTALGLSTPGYSGSTARY